MSDSLKVSLLQPYPIDYRGNTQKYGITKSIIDSTSTLTSLRSLSLPDSSKDQTLGNMHLNITPLEMPILEDSKSDTTIIDNDEQTLNDMLHQFVRRRGHLSTKDDADFNALTLAIKQLLYKRLGGQDESFDPSQYAFEQFKQDVWTYQRRKKISKNGGHLGPRTSRALLGMKYTRYDEYRITPIPQSTGKKTTQKTEKKSAPKPEKKPDTKETNSHRIEQQKKEAAPSNLTPVVKLYSEINQVAKEFIRLYTLDCVPNGLYSTVIHFFEPFHNKSDPSPAIDKQQKVLHELVLKVGLLPEGAEKVALTAYVRLQQADIEFISHREVGTKHSYKAVYKLLDKHHAIARNLACYAKLRHAEILYRDSKPDEANRLLNEVAAELKKSTFKEASLYLNRVAYLRSEVGQASVRKDTDRLNEPFKAPEIH